MDRQAAIEAAQRGVEDLEIATLQLQQDLKYPVTPANPAAPNGNVFLLQFIHPDLIPVLVYHLIRCGWRKDMDKRLVKQRPVIGGQFADLVTYVGLDEPDDPIHVQRPEVEQLWSVKPNVTVQHEKRPND